MKESTQPFYKPIYKDQDDDWFIELWFIPIIVAFIPGLILLFMTLVIN